MAQNPRKMKDLQRPRRQTQKEVVVACGRALFAEPPGILQRAAGDHQEASNVHATAEQGRGPGGLQSRLYAAALRIQPVLVRIDNVRSFFVQSLRHVVERMRSQQAVLLE